ncbi:MAG: signal peptidase I [Kofleriaceae bacterium]
MRKEAVALVREARAALGRDSSLRGKRAELETSTSTVERALASGDLAQVKRDLPGLDAVVDELIVRPNRSPMRDTIESIGVAIMIALLLRAFVVEAFKIPSSSMYPTLEINDHIFVNKFIYGLRIPYTNIKLFERSPNRGDVIVFMQPCEPDRDYIKRVIAVAGDTVEERCNVVYVNGKAIPHELIQGAGCTYKDKNERTGVRTDMPCTRYRETVDGNSHDVFHAEEGRLDDDGFPRDGRVPTCLSDPTPKDPEIKREAAANQLPGSIVVTKQGAEACEQQAHYVVPEGHVFAMGDNRANSRDSRYWGSVPIENIKGEAMFIWLSYVERIPADMQLDRIGNFVE